MARRTSWAILLVLASCGVPAASPAPTPPPSAAPAVASAAPIPSAEPKVAKVLPLVAIVRADWCPACRNVEPKLALIEQEYAGRIAFLRLDVTDEDTTAGATRRADAAGVADFFGESKGRTATIGVFSKDRKELFRTWGLKNETELRQALELAATP